MRISDWSSDVCSSDLGFRPQQAAQCPRAGEGCRMSVEITRLPSGLTVATDSMPGVATVSLGAWIGAGTRHEAPELNGIAHLLEHMVFKGTERRSAQALAEEIEAVGGQITASTTPENTPRSED